jgi:hypothetical protein
VVTWNSCMASTAPSCARNTTCKGQISKTEIRNQESESLRSLQGLHESTPQAD